jgi:hypothetical protein
MPPSKAETHKIPIVLAKLQRVAVSLHHRYEAACNGIGDGSEEVTQAFDRRTEKLEWKAGQLGEEIGLTIDHQRDPRGWPLIVKIGDREERIG